jgi:hypothetical protein
MEELICLQAQLPCGSAVSEMSNSMRMPLGADYYSRNPMFEL